MDSPGLMQQALVMGVVATAFLDLWQRLVARGLGVPATNWALVGRWFSYLPRGRVIHAGIVTSDPVRFEAAVGWIAHYVVGLTYGAIYLAWVHLVLGSGPTLGTALVFGTVTVLAPWCVMQPGMGLGLCARRAPNPTLVRVHSLSGHVVFGAGLYGASFLI